MHLDSGREMRGGQRQLLLLARKLRERGHEQLVVCPATSPLERQLRGDRFETLPVPRSAAGPFGALSQLRRRVKDGSFQVLHAHDGRGQTVSALASLRLPVVRVATRRVTFMPQGLGRLFSIQRLQYGPTCDAIVAVSGFVRDVLVRSGIEAAKIDVIPDGVEIPPVLPDPASRAHLRSEWGLESDAFVIGHAGAFTHEKGQDILINAFLQARNRIPHAQLSLVGDGPLRTSPTIGDLLRRAEGRARILDPLEDLSRFFAVIDVYAMPSRAEGLGSSALLAMAHGIPVVASSVGGLTELVAEGETGWLVQPESPAALAEALVEAASDRNRLRQFGAAARKRAEAFSSDTMVSRTEALYRRLVESAGR